MDQASILVVDDRTIDRKLVERTLGVEGYDVAGAASGEEAIELIRSRLFDAAIVDLTMPGMNGIDLLRAIKLHDSAIEVVLMTAHPTVATAVEALKEGAYDYVSKPLHLDELRHSVARIMERSLLRREVKTLRTKLGEELAVRDLIGDSPAMKRVKDIVAKAAPSDSPVLIEGESGTGKELVAAAIHRFSLRSKGPFIPVNCGAIPADLLESEFFGHIRGAFTGAVADSQGLFRAAHGGTLFLDEVGELPVTLQSKLLRVLQENEVRPVGSTKSYAVDVRIVAATNRNLERTVQEGRLREDLFYRLNVVRVTIPPLRDRAVDIPALAHYFVRRLNERFGRRVSAIGAEAMAALQAYHFPGNVRELENVLERAFAMGTGSEIAAIELPTRAGRASAAPPVNGTELPHLDEAIAQVERELIVRALHLKGGDRERAAQALGVSSRTFYRRLKEHSIT
jgi:two-component system, NtrC family, response regulator PilR